MLYTSLQEIKSLCEIDPDDTQEDKNLNFFNEWASQWIEDELGRPGLTYKVRTEFYEGNNTQNLILNNRPAFSTPTPAVYLDEGANFGATSGAFAGTSLLTYGEDFCLWIDQEDGISSKRGILIRINDVWPLPYWRRTGFLTPYVGQNPGSIKVTYTAGYTVDSLPSSIRFAADTLIIRMRKFFPLALEMTGESYQERSINWAGDRRDYLMAPIKPILHRYKNWRW